MSHHAHGHKIEPKFSVTLFAVTIGLSFAGLCGLFALIAPGVWQAQLAASWWKLALVIVAGHCAAGTFEFFFHRYILHAPLIPFLSRFYKQHTLHHALTRVGFQKGKKGQAPMPYLVENRYPIENEKQFEASYFPWYTLIVFAGLGSFIFAPIQWLLPTYPIILGGWLGITLSLCLYELIHAVEHWPQATWDRLVSQPTTGRLWRKAYAFHLRHHADIRCNEAISGIFGLPLPDWILGTYVDPETLYTHGRTAEPKEFISPQPRFAIIRWLDRQAEQSIKRRRQRRAADDPVTQTEDATTPDAAVAQLAAVARAVSKGRSTT
jgi:hemolysin III